VLRQRGGPFDARLRAAPVRRVIDGEKNGVSGLCPAPMMRLGMFYLAGYLLSVGYLLMFIPQMTMNLLFTNYHLRRLGFTDGWCVSLRDRHGRRVHDYQRRVENVSDDVVRARLITISLLVLYGIYRDPALLVISAVVIIGYILTFIGWRKDTAEWH
jgi:hypothetical protein